MKRIFTMLIMLVVMLRCSSNEVKFNKIKIVESEPKFILVE